VYQPNYPHPNAPGAPKGPKLPISKKMLAIIGGGAAALILIIVLIVVLTGGHRIVGTWEEVDGSTWQGRIQFNRNGSGISFEVNMSTGMVRNEEPIRWSIDRVFGNEVLEILWIDPFNPLWTETDLFHFEITRNIMGDDILTMTDFDGWGGWSLRRVR